MFSYWAKPTDALDLSRRLNDHIAEVVRDHPTRFTGLGTIPIQDPDVAAGELKTLRPRTRAARRADWNARGR